MRDANYKLVGGFALGAIIIGIGMLLFVGSGRFFSERHRFITFFEGSVSGLRVGAPVAINGVPVGSVYDIKVEMDGNDGRIVNPVFVELDRDKIQDIASSKTITLEAEMELLISKGLRAQLRTQSIVTGMLYIELAFFPGTQIKSHESTYNIPQLPTAPSPLQELKETIDSLKVQDIFLRLGNVLVGLDKYINSPEISEMINNLSDTIGAVKITANEAAQLMLRLHQSVEENEGQVTKTTQKMVAVAESLALLSNKAGTVLDAVERSMGDESKLKYEFTESMKEVSASARSLRELAEYLKRNPNALVTGKR